MVDFSFMSGDKLKVNCHSVMVVSLGPFLLDLVRSCAGQADQVIFPDFSIREVCALLNFLYTGMYVTETL